MDVARDVGQRGRDICVEFEVRREGPLGEDKEARTRRRWMQRTKRCLRLALARKGYHVVESGRFTVGPRPGYSAISGVDLRSRHLSLIIGDS